jgi:hypothetical protein
MVFLFQQNNTTALKAVALYRSPSFLHIGYHFFENGQDVSSPVTGNPMGVLDKPGRLLFQLRHRRYGDLHPLILPNQQPYGQTFLLLPDKSHDFLPLTTNEHE